MITPVILCGGSGTRLWPLSRKSFPKQFVPLIDNKSLFELTVERVSELGDKVITVTSEEQRFMVTEQLQATGITGNIILEPEARNTAAAMAIAALHLCESGAPEELLLFCPADHHIPDGDMFSSTIKHGIPAAIAGAIVTFGVVPNYPSTAYGYIEQGKERDDGCHQVTQFIEKPNETKAQELLLQGNVLWNAGIFLARADKLLNALSQHSKDILQACETAMQDKTQETIQDGNVFIRPSHEAFSNCRAQSIDYAVMEPHGNLAIVPFRGQWSDVGSWNALASLTPSDTDENRVEGQGTVHEALNTFIHAPHRPVVALGTQNLIIVDTPDAVLVAHRDKVEQVKEVVTKLEEKKLSQAVIHRKVFRPWGWYDSLDMGERFQVKRIGVKPGASLSLQKHHHRAEHWIVVKGTAEVTRGKEVFLLSENQSTYIPVGELHRLKNPGKIPLEMIEVQSGSYLGEDDIERLDDTYGRVVKK
ncbi:mannose-1-phosphate guanylyltransferase/mannose-6-phosphate isomerase [Kiloniella sp.]|uniref:mannose-1-phosphate guanylyltransferase/mannose-6-phosphate isomerase n=1 Tax=Kiloniella sp. TaxID=1938587 RepID=UPI003B014617